MPLNIHSHLKYKLQADKEVTGQALACVTTVRMDYCNEPISLYPLQILKIMFCSRKNKLETHAKILENYYETW